MQKKLLEKYNDTNIETLLYSFCHIKINRINILFSSPLNTTQSISLSTLPWT